MALGQESARLVVCLRFLVASQSDGFTAPRVLNWPINRCRFLAWMTPIAHSYLAAR